MDNMFAKRKEKLDLFKAFRNKSMVMREKNVPDDLYTKCSECGNFILSETLLENMYVCPDCGGHNSLRAYRRIALVTDSGSFKEMNFSLKSSNPLDFPDYMRKLHALERKTGLKEAVVTGTCRIGSYRAAIAVMDSRFLMGSMGAAAGEKLTRLIEYATKRKLPLIIFSASGGARMQEGIFSLMQMAKTSAAIAKHSAAGLLYISVLSNPTTGGVTASFASLGDIMLAEPNALIGFAGPRVIEQTIKQKLPEGFQRSEFLQECGFLDAVVHRHELRETLISLLKMHTRKGGIELWQMN